ncbi:MAG: DUF2970 domain-containing protein [Candidatus Accumulibacter sp.]|uniref:DUF2970 domain-containing protein n=1 Tax=Accumulibacter sp. TaxID=2053492 RepID=UPI0019E4187A|nr:DUF2970 domain-containing protein [Accumulibacter sp.]MBE2258647.1 DUF2970 domain-containing protein [Paracoccaceae bacterium]MCB1941634.1 DUF2970 domain-containing protein [Accumulibacter sp.]MCP5246977.1 DUF2970 domain-containing protein [Accumulibacter sp.]
MTMPGLRQPKGERFRTIRTVAWALLGIRGHKPHREGAPAMSPLQILITALAFMLVFVLTLVSVAIYISGH